MERGEKKDSGGGNELKEGRGYEKFSLFSSLPSSSSCSVATFSILPSFSLIYVCFKPLTKYSGEERDREWAMFQDSSSSSSSSRQETDKNSRRWNYFSTFISFLLLFSSSSSGDKFLYNKLIAARIANVSVTDVLTVLSLFRGNRFLTTNEPWQLP